MEMPKVATLCSHTSLQIFHGARREGLKSIGIHKGPQPRYYDAFPLARPDKFFTIEDYEDMMSQGVAKRLRAQNAVLIPHGSFVEYVGPERFEKIDVPVYGNRGVLEWESDRAKERKWLEGAGLRMPREVRKVDGPVIVKYHGAKGGRGFFIARDEREVRRRAQGDYVMQEFIPGTRFYFHYFYSPLSPKGYRVLDGNLQLMSMDRRVESGIDEIYRLPGVPGLDEDPGFTVVGNIPLVLRESLVPKALGMGAGVVEKSYDLFGGLWGPFCLECIITKDMDIYCFEISARIVAGTNPFTSGSPYADYVQPGLSTGRRIAQELKAAAKAKRLKTVLS